MLVSAVLTGSAVLPADALLTLPFRDLRGLPELPDGVAEELTLKANDGSTVTVDVTDASSSLIGASTGTPGDGASVEAYTLVVTNASPTMLRLTWVGGPCDSANSLSIDATRHQFLLVQPECPGDATVTDRVLNLEFATPIQASDVEAFLQDDCERLVQGETRERRLSEEAEEEPCDVFGAAHDVPSVEGEGGAAGWRSAEPRETVIVSSPSRLTGSSFLSSQMP